jgi:hypothetical protein
MTILHDTPIRIAELTAGLSETRLQAPPEPGAWSINDILAHLRASHDVLGGNILRIVSEDHPAWKRLSPRAWMRKTDYRSWSFEPSFAAYRRQREELLAVLEPLPAGSWERTATVDEFGSTVERSALFFGDWLAGHEQVHLAQIDETIDRVEP